MNGNNYKIDVSVIVCTYNPNWEKYKLTLSSIIMQKDIILELLICDDGSQEPLYEKVREYLSSNGFTNYKIIDNSINEGTVKNFYRGILHASGEYVYGISPGDFFYKNNTLSIMIQYSKTTNAKVCFGNAIYYTNITNTIDLAAEKYSHPRNPRIYNKSEVNKQKIGLFYEGDSVIGATVLRESTTAKKYFEEIIGISKYLEDNTTLALQVFDGVQIRYFEEYVVVYEYGKGISTDNDRKSWLKLANDWINFCNYLLKKYPGNKLIRGQIVLYGQESRFRKIVELWRISPYVEWLYFYGTIKQRLFNNRMNKMPIDYKFIHEVLFLSNKNDVD